MQDTMLSPTIGIITALEHEYVAIKALLLGAKEEYPDGPRGLRRYLLGTVTAANGGTHIVVAVLLNDMGNNSAAIRATTLLYQFLSVRSIIMVGIAGGVPNPEKAEDHVRLGDVVVSNRLGVVQYDLDKETVTATTHRHAPRPPSASLLEGVRHLAAAALEGKYPWEDFIQEASRAFKPPVARPKGETDVIVSSSDPAVKLTHPSDPDRRKGKPRIFTGPIASANKLLKNPVKRDVLRDHFGVKAVEMEVSGIADASWEVNAGYLVVRGICDYCDSTKGDRWQKYAAVVAAAYTRALLEALPARTDGTTWAGGDALVPGGLPSPAEKGLRGPRPLDMTTGTPSNSGAGAVGMTAVANRLLDRLLARAPEQIKANLRDMRDALREGRVGYVTERLEFLKHDLAQLEVALPADVMSDALRFEAAFELDRSGDARKAEALLNRAGGDRSGDDARIRALLVRARAGSRAALESLAGWEDAGCITLRAAFHLDLGEADVCLQLLARVAPEDDAYTDALRLHALAYLIDKKPDLALSHARKALARERRWALNQHAVAISEYYNALSPTALPDRVLAWPEPVDWPQVKADRESILHLQRAAAIFDDLKATAVQGSEEAHDADVWAMACVANDRERQQEALDRCRALLTGTMGDPHAIVWAIVRGYDIDLAPHVRHIEGLIKSKDATILHVVALVVAYHAGIGKGNTVKAIGLLKKPWVKDLFAGEAQERMWHFWHVRSLVVAGTPENALGALENIDEAMSYPELRREKAGALYAVAVKTGVWEPLIDHLERGDADTDDPSYLYMWCRVMAGQGEWSRVADRAAELVERWATEDAIRLAVTATYNARCLDLCFDLLERQLDLFADRRLPADLGCVRIACMDALGMRRPAIAEAEAVAATPTAANLLQLMELYRRDGNRPALAHHARRLLYIPDLAAFQALRAATFIQQDDRALAQNLWRLALNHPDLPDDLLGTVWVLGFQLGCDDELRPLVERIMALDRQELGGIQVLRVTDLPAMVQRQRAQQEDMVRMYVEGAVPIHTAAWVWRRSLVSLYHDDLIARAAAPDPLRQQALLARHGGHLVSPGFPEKAPAWHLHLDVTAILLAAHLDVLGEVERAFGPLYVAPGVMDDLMEMRDNLDVQQPSRQRLYEDIVTLEAKGAIYHSIFAVFGGIEA